MTKTDQKPTENRLKTDPLQDPDRRLNPKKRGGSVAEIEVLTLRAIQRFPRIFSDFPEVSLKFPGPPRGVSRFLWEA